MKNNLQTLILMTLIVLVSSCAKEQLNEKTEVFPANPGDNFLDDEALLKALDLEDDNIGMRVHLNNVYTLSNEASGNEVIAFTVHPDGTITEKGRYATGGTGTDSGLGNQGALAFGLGGRLLYAVNPGSNDFSVFAVQSDGGLVLKDMIGSGGTQPISITERKSIIYVLNAGGDGNISGFAYNNLAELVPISNSTMPLSTDASGPAQISFNHNGKALVVTEKATNTITSYKVLINRPWTMNTFTALGTTPFGFDFGNNNNFYVSEASMGNPGASTISSYHVDNNGIVTAVDGPLHTDGTAACWVVMTKDRRFMYATNTGSNDVSSVSVSGFGNLTLSESVAATTMPGPIDAAMDENSEYLYVLTTAMGTNAILTYSVDHHTGALTQIDTDDGLPEYVTGLVVR